MTFKKAKNAFIIIILGIFTHGLVVVILNVETSNPECTYNCVPQARQESRKWCEVVFVPFFVFMYFDDA